MPSNGFPRGTPPRSVRRCSMTRRCEPTGSAPGNEARPVTTTDGILPRSDSAGGGLGVVDGQGFHVCEPWCRACTPPARVAAQPLIRKSPKLYRVTVDTRQHCTDNAEGERPPNTSILATLRRCTVGNLSANC